MIRLFVKWLRDSQVSAVILTVIRMYLGYAWLTAGFHKVIVGFDVSGFLQGSIEKANGDHPAVQAWWASFLEGVALPNAGLFNFLVAWGEVLVGLGLILGCFTTVAAFFGVVMNFAFLFSGTVSTNPQMLLLTIFILVAGYNAGRYGLDRFSVPFLQVKFGKGEQNTIAKY